MDLNSAAARLKLSPAVLQSLVDQRHIVCRNGEFDERTLEQAARRNSFLLAASRARDAVKQAEQKRQADAAETERKRSFYYQKLAEAKADQDHENIIHYCEKLLDLEGVPING